MNAAVVEIRVGHELPFEQLLDLYDSVGWAAYPHERRRADLPKAIRNSTYVVSAWSEDTLVGLVRGLSDVLSIFHLQDILVRPEFQGQGIGKQLLGICLERFKHVRSKVLMTDAREQQLRFYESAGLRNIKDLNSVHLNVFVQTDGIG